MVVGGGGSGGQQKPSFGVRKTIQSIKEIVRGHSEADIYAVLKETGMDPNETAQKLLTQDPFHEVKRKRDKKKENTGQSGSADTRKRAEHNVQWTRPQIPWDRTVQRGGYSRNPVPGAGVSRQFRIVRDNRVKQNANKDVKAESAHQLSSAKEKVNVNGTEKSSTGTLSDQKHSAASSSGVLFLSQKVDEPHDSSLNHVKDVVSAGGRRQSEETRPIAPASNSQAQKEVRDKSQTYSPSTSTNSVIGVYSSSSDPVHVPSPVKRSAGAVGAIRREVGVVGVRRQSSNQPVPDGSLSIPSRGKDASSSSESFGQSVSMAKSNQSNQPIASEPVMPTITTGRQFSGSQYNRQAHQQPVGHLKAIQPNMEWKPKSSQKPVVAPNVSETASASTQSHPDNSSSSNPLDVADLSDKLAQVEILEVQHVIIPQHLRVPESERTQLTFGSFGAGLHSAKDFTSAFQTFENTEQSIDEPSASISASVPVNTSEDASAADQGNVVEFQARTSRSNSPTSTPESEQPLAGNNDSLSPHNIESYADIGLVQSHSPPYSSSQAQQLQTSTSLPTFSAYDPQTSYDVPFFRTVMEDNIHGQGLVSSSEAPSSHVVHNSLQSSVALAQQQQQQAVAQMYPQVHLSHYPNFVPYRHIFSPVYVPPMALPNYSNNPAYPHPSSGNSYLLMPGGGSHISAGGMKYAASQYKPVPAGSPTGYGSYTNPAGFITAPGNVGGATGLEDVRIKYKDSNLYVPNPQMETSDIWIQTPRELPSMQSNPYYNLPGQAPHAAAAAFMPAAHPGHASFNAAAAQSSHVQYPGLYHPPPQAASLAGNPHHLVHQPSLGGSIGGVGVAAAPTPQVGTYQQPQLGHLNWSANF